MKFRQFLSSDIAWRLGWALVHSLWQAVAAAALLAIALSVLRRRSPQARYLASLAALGAVLLAALVTFRGAAPPAGVEPVVSTGAAVARHAPPNAVALQSPPRSVPRDADAKPSAIDAKPHGLDRLRTLRDRCQLLLPSAVCIWGFGVLLLALRHTGGWIATQRLRVIGVRPVDGTVQSIADRMAVRLKLGRAVAVLKSLRVETPVVIGWLRPVVLLPASVLSGLTPSQLEAILTHELAHVRRHDYLVNLLQVAAETLMFYHPAVWWISRRIRLEREQCCDDIAVAACGDCCRYVESLAALEEVRLSSPLAVAARGSGESQLLARVRRLLAPDEEGGRRHAGVTLIWAILIAAGATAIACVQHRAPSVARDEVRTPEQLIQKLRASARPIYNLHVIDFELTEEFQPDGSAEWTKTPLRIAGSAWYGDPAGGKARIDVTRQTLAKQSNPVRWFEMAYTVAFDGRSGLLLRYTLGDIGSPGPAKLALSYPSGPPDDLGPNSFDRYATGIAYAPHFVASAAPETPGDQSFAFAIRRAISSGVEVEITNVQFEGRPALQYRAAWRTEKVEGRPPAKLWSVTWFDPMRGYTYLGSEVEIGGTRREREHVTELTEAAPGVWYPLRAWRETLSDPNPGTPKGTHRFTYAAKRVVANDPAFDPAIFTVPIPATYAQMEVKPPVDVRTTFPPSPATPQGEAQRKEREQSSTDLKQIGQALLLWANENNGFYPPDLATAAREEDLVPRVLKSPTGNDQVGYDYVYLHFKGMRYTLPNDLAVAYDAPDAARSGGACVLFADGHVQWLDAAALKDALEDARKRGEKLAPRNPVPATKPAADAGSPRLQLRLVAEPDDASDADEMTVAGGKDRVRVLKEVSLDERHIVGADAIKMRDGENMVEIEFDDQGAALFKALTTANVHHKLAIVFDGKLLSAPMIQTPMSKFAMITAGNKGFTDDEARRLVDALTGGAAATRPVTKPATKPAARMFSLPEPDAHESVKVAARPPGQPDLKRLARALSPTQIGMFEPAMRELLETRDKAAARVRQAKTRYGEKHPALVKLNSELEAYNAQVEQFTANWKDDPTVAAENWPKRPVGVDPRRLDFDGIAKLDPVFREKQVRKDQALQQLDQLGAQLGEHHPSVAAAKELAEAAKNDVEQYASEWRDLQTRLSSTSALMLHG